MYIIDIPSTALLLTSIPLPVHNLSSGGISLQTDRKLGETGETLFNDCKQVIPLISISLKVPNNIDDKRNQEMEINTHIDCHQITAKSRELCIVVF